MTVDITEDADAKFAGDLTALTRICEKYTEVRDQLRELDRRASEMKAFLTRLETVDIPEAAKQCGQSSFTLWDGRKVEIKTDVTASISEDNQHDAFVWLRDNGHGDLIKNEIKVAFGRGDDNRAKMVEGILHENDVDFTSKEAVHPQTLKAWAKEQLQKGANIPFELFGVYQWHKAVIKEK